MTEDGAVALFFRPHPGAFDSSRVTTPGNLPSKVKIVLMPGGQPGGSGLGTAGIDCCITFQCVYSILMYYHKELHRDEQLSRSQTSANSKRGSNTEHNTLWDKVKLINRDPHCCCLRDFYSLLPCFHIVLCIPLIGWFLLLDH